MLWEAKSKQGKNNSEACHRKHISSWAHMVLIYMVRPAQFVIHVFSLQLFEKKRVDTLSREVVTPTEGEKKTLKKYFGHLHLPWSILKSYG